MTPPAPPPIPPVICNLLTPVLLPAGEIKLSTIQKNVKRVMREEFSLFSLGIGFDVDYDFLERIAMENRGVAQRIYANHDAAEQLRVRFPGFTQGLN